MNGYGAIYVADGATGQAVTSTPAKMTGFTTAQSNTNGNLSVSPDVDNDKVTVKAGGIYLVCFHADGASSVNGEIQANVRVGGSEVAYGQCRAAIGANSAASNGTYQLTANGISMQCLITPSSDSDVEIYLESSTSLTFTPKFANLTIVRIA